MWGRRVAHAAVIVASAACALPVLPALQPHAAAETNDCVYCVGHATAGQASLERGKQLGRSALVHALAEAAGEWGGGGGEAVQRAGGCGAAERAMDGGERLAKARRQLVKKNKSTAAFSPSMTTES
jgi:hypothetical protein